MVQTGAKTQLGGAKTGLFKAAYQVGIAEVVNNEPTTPAAKQTPIDKINFGKLLGITPSIPNF